MYSRIEKRRVAPGKTIQQYQERLAMELKVIHEMGFDDYFLIVWDVMNFAHQQKITTDPGRGSAAGSLVAYALAITEVDPLQYDLLFERFLNPERAQMPDIDLDIPDNRRDEVLQYVHQKYGHQRVAQIITFGTLAAKQVVRDVSRVFNLPRYDMQRLIDALPHGLHVTLKDALKESQQLKNLLDDNPKFRLLIQVAQQLEGLPRHYSIHAAGIVLSEQPLHEIVPLQDGSDGLLMTQFAKDTVEALGLLKMDFLGLKNLSIMDNILQMIRQEDPNFDLQKINFNDPLTLQLFQRGKTEGIFQFESSGIRNVLVNLHPTNFEDIVAVNALYRPGPMENISHFTARKAGKEKITYPAPSLEKILGPTYGILVYQEQVMQLASVMAGFTLGEADLLRRAMSKKKKATMEDMRTKFIAGATEHGYSAQVAHQVFEYIDRFANYGFNRSHAVAYSMMAFEMAYLKVYYPAAFLQP
ncbi:DNA polymerase III subunit alpha [Limosilactobacillus reuteri]|nr:DNA polymerase III subunit alpha [Limosilactobacillus reuteri]